jgi:hypothetical protein
MFWYEKNFLSSHLFPPNGIHSINRTSTGIYSVLRPRVCGSASAHAEPSGLVARGEGRGDGGRLVFGVVVGYACMCPL